jgi:photosystem II stability/assembly factor-like uncharacterized protein
MKHSILAIIISSLISIPCIAQTAWYNQNSGTNAILQDVFFVDQDYGWASGGHIILHTSNGGNTWAEQPAPPVQIYYVDIFFLDRMNGWACGNEAKIIHTTDGGNTWVEQPNPYTFPNPILYSIYFANADTGWAFGGDHGSYPTFTNRRVVLYTTNGGNTWDFQYSNSGNSYRPIYSSHFISSTEGFAACEYGNIMYTSNGGNTWIEKSPVSSFDLYGIYFTDSNTGWVSGEYLGVPHYASISKTTDGGNSWTTQAFGTDEELTDIYFVNNMMGWAVGGTIGGSGTSTILHTIDGGENWSMQSSPTTNTLYGLSFSDINNGWAVGFNGTVIAYTIPVTAELEQSPPSEFSLNQNYPNPFNPSTTIEYSIPERTDVKMTVINIVGEEVAELVNQIMDAGSYSVEFNSHSGEVRNPPSGVYFYRLQVSNSVITKKMLLLK